MGNLVDMAFLIERFGHLGIPHLWVVPCLFMGDVVHSLLNNFLLTLYLVLLIYFYFMGFEE